MIIELGTRFTFADPQIAYETDAPNEEAARAVDKPSPPFAAAIRRAPPWCCRPRGDAVGARQSNGYADAAALDRRVVVDHASAEVAAQFPSAPATWRVSAMCAREPGDVLRPGFVDDLQNWQTGDVYSPQALARLRRDLTSTGAVLWLPRRWRRRMRTDCATLSSLSNRQSRNAYELGVSYSTTEEAGVQASGRAAT